MSIWRVLGSFIYSFVFVSCELWFSFRIVLFVWIVSAMTVTKVVEDCVYIRRRYYGILPRVGGDIRALRSLSDLSLALSSKATTLNHLIRLRGSQGIQIWKQRTTRTNEAFSCWFCCNSFRVDRARRGNVCLSSQVMLSYRSACPEI